MKNMNKTLLGIFIMGLLMIGSVSAGLGISSITPVNESSTYYTNPDFSGVIVGNGTTIPATLYVNRTGAYENCGSKTCTNNTRCTIASTCAFSQKGDFTWYLNITDDSSETNTTGIYIITYTGGMSAVSGIINEVVVVFGAIINIVVGAFQIVITVAIIGFVLVLMNEIFHAVDSKIKGINK